MQAIHFIPFQPVPEIWQDFWSKMIFCYCICYCYCYCICYSWSFGNFLVYADNVVFAILQDHTLSSNVLALPHVEVSLNTPCIRTYYISPHLCVGILFLLCHNSSILFPPSTLSHVALFPVYKYTNRICDFNIVQYQDLISFAKKKLKKRIGAFIVSSTTQCHLVLLSISTHVYLLFMYIPSN